MIANNHISDEGALYLADVLRNNKVIYITISFGLDLFSIQILKQLNIANNQIGDCGVQHLVDSLRNNNVNK